jgi:hypothetical protein
MSLNTARDREYVVYMENLIGAPRTFVTKETQCFALEREIRERYNVPEKCWIVLYTRASGIVGRKLIVSDLVLCEQEYIYVNII